MFVSSTFRDMQRERDVLVKRVFPQLRKRCEERAVGWTEVDLRWGITDEQSADGRVLPICLEEIRLCRPYFIGLLGERYGWIPAEIDPVLEASEPWLREHRSRSVTELEMLHGVLNDPGMRAHAYFYFRDSAYVDSLPAGERLEFTEPSGGEAGDSRAAKLARLKDRIRRAHAEGSLTIAPREGYADPDALGDLVLADFTALIDRLFPAEEVPDPLERERLAHEAYGRSRAMAFVPRPAYSARLSAFAQGDGPGPLVVTGESGSGKSALLAAWVGEYREANPEAFCVQHFVGSTHDSADWVQILRRLMGELGRAFSLGDPVPADSADVLRAFPDWLVKVATGGRLVIVLDGLNQLADRDEAPDLGWLPVVLPPNVRLIVSTVEGRALDALRRRGWLAEAQTLHVGPFTAPERREAIRVFLGHYRKRLSDSQTERLVAAPQTGSPLFLRVVLDEVRQFGRHEELEACLADYLGAGTPTELFDRVLARWDRDYAAGRDLVRQTCGFIAAARRGVSESELRDLLGGGEPLPRALWTPLFLAAENALVNRAGQLSFGHQYLRDAVTARWLPAAEDLVPYRRRLASYFGDLGRLTDRGLDELPWLLVQVEAWADLTTVLTHAGVFARMMDGPRRWDLPQYWLALQPHADPVATYREALETWSRAMSTSGDARAIAWLIHAVGAFHENCGRYAVAEPLLEAAADALERLVGPDHPDVLSAALAVGRLRLRLGDHAGAAERLEALVADAGRALGPTHVVTLTAVNDLAMALVAGGRYADALALLRGRSEEAARALGPDHATVRAMRGNLALTIQKSGDYPAAEVLLREHLAIDERLLGRDHPEALTAAHNLASTLEHQRKYEEALANYERCLAAKERTLGVDHPDTLLTVHSIGNLFGRQYQFARAEPFFRRALAGQIRVLGRDHPETLFSLVKCGYVLGGLGDAAGAEHAFSEAIAGLTRVFGADHPDTLAAVSYLAYHYEHTGRLPEAERIFRQALAGYERALGPEHPYTLTTVSSLARTLGRMGRWEEAASLYRRALDAQTRVLGPDHPETRDAAAGLERATAVRPGSGTQPL